LQKFAGKTEQHYMCPSQSVKSFMPSTSGLMKLVHINTLYPEARKDGGKSNIWILKPLFYLYQMKPKEREFCVTWGKVSFLIKPFSVFLIFFSTQEKIELKLQKHSLGDILT
jgi:hypothetical protein